MKSIGAAGATSVLALGTATTAQAWPQAVAPSKYANRFKLWAEGNLTDMVWPWPPGMDPAQMPPVKLRLEFPWAEEGQKLRDLLQVVVYMVLSPEAPFVPISVSRQRADKIALGESGNQDFPYFFSIYGPIVDNPVRSPFGELEGLTALNFASFDHTGDETNFHVLGGAVAGNHATAVMSAGGSLKIRGSWQAF